MATAQAGADNAGAVDGYEKALQDMADFETEIAGSSQLDWLQAVARSHTKFVTDLVSIYANAIRLVSAEQKQAGLECAFGIFVELEGSDRPACVIETVVIYR